jgi:hypothetical protein
MRNISCSMIALALAAVAAVACGPSGKQIATAKQARYQGDQQQIFSVIKQTVEASHKVERADDAAYGLQTVGRWFNPEGQALPNAPDDIRDVPDRSLNIALVVTLVPEGAHHVVSVKPLIVRYRKNEPKPEIIENPEADRSIPDWAHSKGDDLQVALHKALAQYEVKVTGAAPAGGPAPGSAAPATPTPSPDPAGGSAVSPPPPAP